MHCMSKRLLAFCLAALLAPVSVFAQDGSAILTGKLEAGAAGVGVSDSKTRVNEYSVIRPEPGVTGYEKADIFLYDPRGIVLEGESNYMGSHDQGHAAKLDLNRILRSSFEYQSFEHQLDHDQIDYLDAAVIRGDHTNTDLTGQVPAFLLVGPDAEGNIVVKDSASTADGLTAGENDWIQQTGGATLKGEDLVPNQDFSIVYREWINETEFTHPSLPNVTFDLKFRHQEREGMEQSIGMSKCSGCHVTGKSRRVDEVTEDITAGVTGKFGLFTLRYAFTDRQFDEKADAPTTIYDVAASPGKPLTNTSFDNRITYDYANGELPFDMTPDSDKQSHVLKAKVDLPNNTIVLGNYVNTKIESTKREEAGIFSLSKQRLTTTYDIYGMRAATWLGGLKLSAHARVEDLENDDVNINFVALDGTSLTTHRESVIGREVLTAGIDGMYRFGRYTTARLGYEYEEEDRDDEHFGSTETSTVKASLHTRPMRNLTGRVSYTFKDVENPFHLPHAAGVPLTENTTGTTVGTGPRYGIDFYNEREWDLSNQPDTVHETKVSATWSPLPRFAATATYRYTGEENELNHSTWEQQTHAPGVSMWYAPSDRLNLTFAYNYFDQRTETAFCQGYYDG